MECMQLFAGVSLMKFRCHHNSPAFMKRAGRRIPARCNNRTSLSYTPYDVVGTWESPFTADAAAGEQQKQLYRVRSDILCMKYRQKHNKTRVDLPQFVFVPPQNLFRETSLTLLLWRAKSACDQFHSACVLAWRISFDCHRFRTACLFSQSICSADFLFCFQSQFRLKLVIRRR